MLIHKMRETEAIADVMNFSAAISACEKGGQWEQALELLPKMHDTGTTTKVTSFAPAISACEKGGQ